MRRNRATHAVRETSVPYVPSQAARDERLLGLFQSKNLQRALRRSTRLNLRSVASLAVEELAGEPAGAKRSRSSDPVAIHSRLVEGLPGLALFVSSALAFESLQEALPYFDVSAKTAWEKLDATLYPRLHVCILTNALMLTPKLRAKCGSTGATNVLRTAGKGAAAFVFLVDIAKGYLPVLLAVLALRNGWVPEVLHSPLGPWLPVAAATLALVGHSKSIFLNWRGGKSAATGFGTLLAMNAPAALGAFAIFITIVWLSRYVSLASMIAAICAPILMYLFDPDAVPFVTYCLCGAVYVIIRHKANIRRLMAGAESKIGQKLKLDAPAQSQP